MIRKDQDAIARYHPISPEGALTDIRPFSRNEGNGTHYLAYAVGTRGSGTTSHRTYRGDHTVRRSLGIVSEVTSPHQSLSHSYISSIPFFHRVVKGERVFRAPERTGEKQSCLSPVFNRIIVCWLSSSTQPPRTRSQRRLPRLTQSTPQPTRVLLF